MIETFDLVVNHKDVERNFDAELRVYGYTHKIAIMVDGTEVIFEPDEERNYRAVIPENEKNLKFPDMGLLKDIAQQLDTSFK